MQINIIKITCILLVCITVSICAVVYGAPSETVDYFNGIKAYRSGQYQEAAGEFLKIAETGISNGKLFYNLGNAYLKREDVGRAILWYERAQQLMPRDPDIKFNLDYARGVVRDRAEEKISPLIETLFFWNYILSFREIIWISIACIVLFWTVNFFRRVYTKKISMPAIRIVHYTLLTLSIILVLTCFYNYYERSYAREGIILPQSVSIRSGLSDTSTQLFVLHAGSKVKIQSEKEDYVKIYFSSGKLGWIKRSDVGIINP